MIAPLIVAIILGGACLADRPVVKYRYEVQDVMKTAETQFPLRGYQVVEGGYYPDISPLGTYHQQASAIPYRLPIPMDYLGGNYGHNYGSNYGSNYAGFSSPAPIYASPVTYYRHHNYHPSSGDGYVEKSAYRGEKKDLNDGQYEKHYSDKGETADQGSQGFAHDQKGLKNVKADSGTYKDEEGVVKKFDDGKAYHGGHHFTQAGENADSRKIAKGHKKGKVTKGFKTSHHKDESGHTETFYDEEHDEGGDNFYKNGSGAYGENAQSAFKGSHEAGNFNNDQKSKQGHYDNHQFVDNSNADKGQYGQRKYIGSGVTYSKNNGVDQRLQSGHQEADKFYQHRNPHYY